jgi:hypothetical protein
VGAGPPVAGPQNPREWVFSDERDLPDRPAVVPPDAVPPHGLGNQPLYYQKLYKKFGSVGGVEEGEPAGSYTMMSAIKFKTVKQAVRWVVKTFPGSGVYPYITDMSHLSDYDAWYKEFGNLLGDNDVELRALFDRAVETCLSEV